MPPDNERQDDASDPARWERDAARRLDAMLSGDDQHGFAAGRDEVHGFEDDLVGVGFTGGKGVHGPGSLHDGCRPRLSTRPGCLLPLSGLGLLVALLILFYLFAGGDGDADGSVVGGGESSVEASASAAATSVATAEPSVDDPRSRIGRINEAVIDQILFELYVTTDIPSDQLEYFEDLLLDYLDSISGNKPTYTPGSIDLRLYGGFRARFTGLGVKEAWGNTIFACGDNSGGRIVVCPANVEPMPEAGGDVWMFAMVFDETVPAASPDHSFTYSAVFDSDGDAANDWQFFPPFDFDLFQGADRWYQLVWDHNAGAWSITVTQVDGSQQTALAPSAVRALIEGDTIVFFIPASEFQLDQPPYRLTSFGHDGAFSESDRGADVSGVDPAAALTVPPGDFYLAMPEDR